MESIIVIIVRGARETMYAAVLRATYNRPRPYIIEYFMRTTA